MVTKIKAFVFALNSANNSNHQEANKKVCLSFAQVGLGVVVIGIGIGGKTTKVVGNMLMSAGFNCHYSTAYLKDKNIGWWEYGKHALVGGVSGGISSGIGNYAWNPNIYINTAVNVLCGIAASIGSYSVSFLIKKDEQPQWNTIKLTLISSGLGAGSGSFMSAKAGHASRRVLGDTNKSWPKVVSRIAEGATWSASSKIISNYFFGKNGLFSDLMEPVIVGGLVSGSVAVVEECKAYFISSSRTEQGQA